MRAICVEDEPLTLEYTAELCGKLNPPVHVECFTDAKSALTWIQDNPVDLALLDINMPDMNGIVLAARIKERWPDANILFLTAYREFAFDAFSVHPSGYLLKPVTLDALQKEIDYTRSAHPRMGAAHIQAVTFGNFELLVDGVLVEFKRSKAKELLAYLIDRQGTSVTRAEISAVLFEDELYDHSRQKYLDVIIRSLRSTLLEYGADELLQARRKGLRIDPALLDCDMYRFCKGDADAVRSYRGEYMSSYSWASPFESYAEHMRDVSK